VLQRRVDAAHSEEVSAQAHRRGEAAEAARLQARLSEALAQQQSAAPLVPGAFAVAAAAAVRSDLRGRCDERRSALSAAGRAHEDCRRLLNLCRARQAKLRSRRSASADAAARCARQASLLRRELAAAASVERALTAVLDEMSSQRDDYARAAQLARGAQRLAEAGVQARVARAGALREEAVAAAASAREVTHRTRRLAADAAESERRLLSELQACGARTLSLVAAQGALCVRLEAAAAAHRSAETSRSNVRAALSAAIAKLARLRERLGLGNATCASAQSSLLESSAAAADAQRRLCSARRSLAAAALRLQAVPQLEVEVATRQATLLEERQRAAAEMQARLAAPPLRRLQPPSRAELDRRTSALRAAVDAKQRELSALKADLLNSQEACEATRLRLAAAQASSRVSVAQQLNAQQAKLFATQRSVQALTAELRLYTAAIDRLAERRQFDFAAALLESNAGDVG
jgi:hypothetical protein